MVSTSGSSGTAPYPSLDRHVPRGRSELCTLTIALGQHRPGDARRGLLGVLLRPPLAHAPLGSCHEHPGPVAPGVVGPGALDLVAGQLADATQHDLLQAGLEVLGTGPGRGQLDPVAEDVEDDA